MYLSISLSYKQGPCLILHCIPTLTHYLAHSGYSVNTGPMHKSEYGEGGLERGQCLGDLSCGRLYSVNLNPLPHPGKTLHENHCTTRLGQAREPHQSCSVSSVEMQKNAVLISESMKPPLEMECLGKCLRVGFVGFLSPLKMTFKTGCIHIFLRWGGDP